MFPLPSSTRPIDATPLERLLAPPPARAGSRQGVAPASLWVKRDDLTHPVYGGNKPRKLVRILDEAERRGARRLVTFGAAGSHHVLATTLFGRMRGLPVAAVLLPQQHTEHASEMLRASVAQGAELRPCSGPARLPWVIARTLRRGDFVIPPGGADLHGTLGYVEAVAELRGQLEGSGEPAPDVIVVATGSGGTAAGLAVGLEREGLPGRVVCVAVASMPRATAAMTAALAARVAGALSVPVRGVLARLAPERRYVGAGYGHRTAEGARASRLAATAGLSLDPTYTEKALAAALDRVALGREARVLFWNTLSSAPMGPLLVGAPAEGDLPAELRALLPRGTT
jgi:D-cysteine desulfhydrase